MHRYMYGCFARQIKRRTSRNTKHYHTQSNQIDVQTNNNTPESKSHHKSTLNTHRRTDKRKAPMREINSPFFDKFTIYLVLQCDIIIDCTRGVDKIISQRRHQKKITLWTKAKLMSLIHDQKHHFGFDGHLNTLYSKWTYRQADMYTSTDDDTTNTLHYIAW